MINNKYINRRVALVEKEYSGLKKNTCGWTKQKQTKKTPFHFHNRQKAFKKNNNTLYEY